MSSTFNLLKTSTFTIIEFLIVIAVMGILLSLLQPSLRNTIDNANQLQCKNKMKTIGTAFLIFSEDHDQHLPGTVRDNNNPELNKRNWMGTETGFRDNDKSKRMRGNNREGTIWPYLSSGLAGQFYRCPSLEEGEWNSGIGSNGLFDYVSFNAFSGAKVNLMPSNSYYGNAPTDSNYIPPRDQMEKIITPIVTEEAPGAWLNRTHIEPGHGGGDRLDNRHFGGANYAAIDGSAHWMEFTYRGPKSFEWRTFSPKGHYVGISNGIWGHWNQR